MGSAAGVCQRGPPDHWYCSDSVAVRVGPSAVPAVLTSPELVGTPEPRDSSPRGVSVTPPKQRLDRRSASRSRSRSPLLLRIGPRFLPSTPTEPQALE